MMKFILFITLLVSLLGCRTLKPYEKEFLLNPAMDDASLSEFNESFKANIYAKYEKVSGGAASSSGSTSCPTCGG
jgi:hypothetical protein